MKEKNKRSTPDVVKAITSERKRTNILRNVEHLTIAWLVQRIPSWISSNMLTGIGFFGNFMVFGSFVLAAYYGRIYLLLGVLGFMISWFGDSLDGRIAYYRNIPRKWYGFVLDITVDWLGIMFMGYGFMVYVDQPWKFLAYVFLALYGWEVITAQLRYKVTGHYSIDSGLFGPTELRIIISAILIIEFLFPGSILYLVGLILVILLIVSFLDFNKLLNLANDRDASERKK